MTPAHMLDRHPDLPRPVQFDRDAAVCRHRSTRLRWLVNGFVVSSALWLPCLLIAVTGHVVGWPALVDYWPRAALASGVALLAGIAIAGKTTRVRTAKAASDATAHEERSLDTTSSSEAARKLRSH